MTRQLTIVPVTVHKTGEIVNYYTCLVEHKGYSDRAHLRFEISKSPDDPDVKEKIEATFLHVEKYISEILALNLKREFEVIEYVSESDNRWTEFEVQGVNHRVQIIGTIILCLVRHEETGKIRSMTQTIAPEYSLEDSEVKELIEITYKHCEWALKKDLAKLSEQGLKEKSDEFRSQNIV